MSVTIINLYSDHVLFAVLIAGCIMSVEIKKNFPWIWVLATTGWDWETMEIPLVKLANNIANNNR